MTVRKLDRRNLLRLAVGNAGALLLSGCDQDTATVDNGSILNLGEAINRRVQRLIMSKGALAPEYAEAEISPTFKANGTESPPDHDYQALAKAGFSDWRLIVEGLVQEPLQLSLEELRAMPSRTQITRHDCVEGWSCIGKWKGVPLATILQRAGLKPQARFVVFHCADSMGDQGLDVNADDTETPAKPDAKTADGQTGNADANGSTPEPPQVGTSAQSQDSEADSPVPKYYESLDLVDAFHPQTLVAYDMNNAPLTIPHGAPVRLRVERQLGYKSAKYLMRIEVVDSFAKIGEGRGGYWEDQGYDWYAGI
jgi:DMSO/TMAO reductase YedYZ molybdopterin-dependent catalytic subunit